ncbi:hypothetical protein [Pelagibacterium halotolerans]|uniref:Uncharacterized protein n=1 Tax=Pelagibacterium halotolerans (strain DSM 22347 / JCM 15775 / CGMCC 1.7692 / B2) TaxID=1082931 RepID=G4RG54_PELHB|nr:hypothetical protein [Pelagibacterium halotolerans]AEQ52068.1 hypothetical protein KKY_2058 [Pelagibacterium halotolerans B2]QJR18156.1 hypothetical protein HKM20_06730 [Pelagibacterium halotolerans]SDZ82770.1 hypothetical protein SAMN05428936_101130 [Pelagibacterium halotolerans]
MSFPGFARRPARSASSAPIRGYNRRGFAIGWLAIIGLAVAGYMFASSQLSPSSAHLRLANIAGTVHTVIAPG